MGHTYSSIFLLKLLECDAAPHALRVAGEDAGVGLERSAHLDTENPFGCKRQCLSQCLSGMGTDDHARDAQANLCI